MAVILTRKLQSMGLAIVMMTSDVFILMHKKKKYRNDHWISIQDENYRLIAIMKTWQVENLL